MKTLENIKACSRFLTELINFGVPLKSLGTMEAAYWFLLKNESLTSLDSTSPFVGDHEIDFAKVSADLDELIGEVRLDEAKDELIGFCQAASEAQWSGGIEEGVRNGTPDGPSLGAMCRAARNHRTHEGAAGREENLSSKSERVAQARLRELPPPAPTRRNYPWLKAHPFPQSHGSPYCAALIARPCAQSHRVHLLIPSVRPNVPVF